MFPALSVAVKTYVPATVFFGMVNEQAKSPVEVVFAVHASPPDHVTVTTELVAKPVPTNPTNEPGGPEVGTTYRADSTSNAAVAELPELSVAVSVYVPWGTIGTRNVQLKLPPELVFRLPARQLGIPIEPNVRVIFEFTE